jgi:hypothetical protein
VATIAANVHATLDAILRNLLLFDVIISTSFLW